MATQQGFCSEDQVNIVRGVARNTAVLDRDVDSSKETGAQAQYIMTASWMWHSIVGVNPTYGSDDDFSPVDYTAGKFPAFDHFVAHLTVALQELESKGKVDPDRAGIIDHWTIRLAYEFQTGSAVAVKSD